MSTLPKITVCTVYGSKGAWFDIATRRIAPAPGLLEAYASLVRTADYTELPPENASH